MEALIKSRGILKGKITSFNTYLSKTLATYPDTHISLDEVTRLEIRERIYRLREAYERFEQIQANIEELTENLDEALEYREKFDEDYFRVIAQAEALRSRGMLEAQLPGVATNEVGSQAPLRQADNEGIVNAASSMAWPANQNITYKPTGLKLPTIELPKFDGDAAEWLSFRDSFESLIHENEMITVIQKYHYLKAAVQGIAAQVIKSVEFSAAGYPVAWETLCKRFNNQRLLTHNHIQALFNIKLMKEESAVQIRETVDSLGKHLRSLNALGQVTEHWDALLIYLISTKLDSATARGWEKERAKYELPTLQNFTEFLESRADLLETLHLNDKTVPKQKQADKSKVKSFLVQTPKCSLCHQTHKLNTCSRFLELSPQQRANHLKTAKLCLNCMKPGHFLKDCRAGACKKCSAKHNTLLHFEKTTSQQTSTGQEEKTSATLCSHNQCNSHNVLLATASILVIDSQGRKHKARAILDPGSQSSLITAKFCKEAGLETSKFDMKIEAINGMSSKVEHKCNVRLLASHNNYGIDIQCLVIPEITGRLPSQQLNVQDLQIPDNIRLADPTFHIPGRVDILIGGDCFWSLLCVGQVKVGQGQVTMQKTKLGWIAVGPWMSIGSDSVKCNLSRAIDIDKNLARFWEIEELEDRRVLSIEESECEKHFIENTYRNEDGRFVVSIPLKRDIHELGESKSLAHKRLISLEKRLGRNHALRAQYIDFLEEYQRLGHMCRISEEAVPNSYYMPHHSVIKVDSSSTRVRVVFDASTASDNGVSLNELQMVGPTVQDDLFSLLVRFRTHQ